MITTGYFDIETTNLNADFGIVLCAVIQDDQGNEIILRGDQLNKSWKTKRSDDSILVGKVAEALSPYDIIVGHNGLLFDIAFLRTRLLRWGLGAFPDKKLIDPWMIAKRKLRMHSNSLRSLCDFLTTSEKTEVLGDVWMRCAYDGDTEAMDYIVEHCRQDVRMLADLTTVIKPYIHQFDSWGSSK